MRSSPPAPNGSVYIIDDDPALLANIRALVEFAGYRVKTWATPEAFLAEIPNDVPAALITDMQMPGLSGLQLHQTLKERGRDLPVIYISGRSSAKEAVSAMKLSAHDFLVKPFQREELLDAIATAIERDRRAMQKLLEKARKRAGLESLSPRELQVYGLLLKGFSNKEIVAELGIALETAKQYKGSVMRKLEVRSLSELLESNTSTS